MCLIVEGKKRIWYLDSGCSRHMTGDKEAFITLRTKEGGMVTFGDDGKDHIIGIGKIQIIPQTYLENVLYVLGLKHNLISISQLCDRGYKVSFESSLCIVINSSDDSTIFIKNRQDNIYMIDLHDINIVNHCLVANNAKSNELGLLWHRRLEHASICLIDKLIKKDLDDRIPQISFEEDKI